MVSLLKHTLRMLPLLAVTAYAQILPVANGGTGTSNPGLIPGNGIAITGTWPDQTISATGSGTTPPFLLKFGPPNVLPYYDPQPHGLIDISDSFATTSTFTQQTGGGTVAFSVASNIGTVTMSGSTYPAFANFQETGDTTLVAPQFFDSIEVTSITTGAGFSNIYAGAYKDNNNYVGVYYDATNHAIHTEYRYGGTNQNSTLKSITLTPPYWIGASLVGNSLSGWYKTSATGNWIYAGNVQTTANHDYTVTSNFASAGYKTGFSVAWDAAGSVSVANLQGGRFGGAIMRDLKPVVNADWTTYQPGGNSIYFTATVGDPAGTQIGPSNGSTQGVFTLNVDSQTITETGVICDARSSHTYCGDAAGHIIYHSSGDREVLLSSWGDQQSGTPVKIMYEYLTNGVQPDVLTNNLTVLSSATALTVPMASGALDAYDPALAYDATNSRYLLAYTQGTISPLVVYPALATASSPTGTWTSIGIDNSLQGNWEGTSFANVSGALYELTGGPRFWPQSATWPSCNTSRIYDETFTYQGSLVGATFINGSASPSLVNCSHPTLVQHPDGLHVMLLTFDGTEFLSGNTGSTGRPIMEISTQ